ncbi:hypothetical protein RND71_023840 [Anisodus tanguticus]|uniref:aldehyde dehydrogenase (NAD(+)) n=1 Tax=Anisodus tanguticus TaxID=243964 RepID=A0AAE1RV55_9SOLA|nr:hypothetical protein RND71_023840 [Anisodus tanguticus]
MLTARKAFDEGPWPRMTAYERTKVLLRLAGLIEKHNDQIATLETWDTGKPYEHAAKIEVPMVIGPALATGNSIVLKTAEQTPLSAFYVANLLQEAGLPEGVLNMVSGFCPTAGAALCSHMDVDKLAFTGSTDTGKAILALAAKSNLKPVTLELGGKSPFIVCEDADIDTAIEQAHFALFFNQGQCYCTGSRTYVHEKVYDEFLEKAKALALKRTVGDPFKSGTEQGPKIDSKQFEKIMKYIRSGVESGATLETAGERFGEKGYYIKPTVFSNIKDDMLIVQDEIFGPVQSILKFKDLDEVVKKANNSRYGLAAGYLHSALTLQTPWHEP